MKKAIVYLMVLVFTVVAMLPAQASSLSDAKDQQSSITSKLLDIQQKKKDEELKRQREREIAEQAEASLDASSDEYKELMEQIDYIENHIASLEKSIEDAEADYIAQKELLKTRLRVMYENSNISIVQTLMESKSIIDFLEKVQLITQITQSDKEMLADINSKKKDIEAKKKMSLAYKADKDEKAKTKQDMIDGFSSTKEAAIQNITDINQKLQDIEDEETRLEQAQTAINNTIRSLMSHGDYTGGSMTWPVPGYTSISSPYGYRYHPISGVYKMHTGIDIPAPSGTSIVAVNGGKVIVAGWDDAYGNHIVIDHGGGIASFYGHLSSILVSVGEQVNEGEIIGRVGTTGYSTGPHLHFGIIKDGQNVDPTKYV